MRKKGSLCVREDIFSNEGNCCTMATCTGGRKKFSSVRQTRSLKFRFKLFNVLS